MPASGRSLSFEEEAIYTILRLRCDEHDEISITECLSISTDMCEDDFSMIKLSRIINRLYSMNLLMRIQQGGWKVLAR